MEDLFPPASLFVLLCSFDERDCSKIILQELFVFFKGDYLSPPRSICLLFFWGGADCALLNPMQPGTTRFGVLEVCKVACIVQADNKCGKMFGKR